MPIYDELPGSAQGAVRKHWDDRIAAALVELDFTESLNAAGTPWAEADDNGNLVIREAASLPS